MALIKIKEKKERKVPKNINTKDSKGRLVIATPPVGGKKVSKTQKKGKKQPKQKQVRGHAKRYLENRAPKINENPKTAMLLKTTTASKYIVDVLKDLARLKAPHSKLMVKKNEIHPFDDANSVEFLAQKNDCSLFGLASDSKKRPNNIVLGRLFNFQLLDMFELGVTNYKSIESFKGQKALVGHKPCFIFQGDIWEYNEDYKLLKNLLLDFFRGEQIDKISLSGLDEVIVCSATFPDNGETPSFFLRVYVPLLKKSGSSLPRIELLEQGPAIDFELRRKHMASKELKRDSLKIPRTIKPKKVKNVSHNPLGDKLGRVHMEKQDMTHMQTRKIKALKIIRKEKKFNKDTEEEN
ncbi:hypothetical protein WA158_004752 [Blastocystis sp. Blastoise]